MSNPETNPARLDINHPSNGGSLVLQPADSASKKINFSAELRRRILHFTPSWFSVNMGTGITSILLHNLPYNNSHLQRISVCIFVLNIGSHTHTLRAKHQTLTAFCASFSPIFNFLGHVYHSIHPLPRSVELDDTKPSSLSFPRDFPYGVCNNC